MTRSTRLYWRPSVFRNRSSRWRSSPIARPIATRCRKPSSVCPRRIRPSVLPATMRPARRLFPAWASFIWTSSRTACSGSSTSGRVPANRRSPTVRRLPRRRKPRVSSSANPAVVASTATRSSRWNRARRARGSPSTTRWWAATFPANTSPPWSRAFAKQPRPASSVDIRWSI